MAKPSKRLQKVMPTISAPASKTEEGNIGKAHLWQYIPQRMQDLNVSWNIFDWAYISYNMASKKWKYVAWSWGWEVNTASNIWTGTWLYDSKLWADLRFKSLVAWSWIVITTSWNDVNIASNISQLTCTDIVNCIESESSITLQWLTVSWDTTLHNLMFSAWSTIDFTNTTSTWNQTFDSNYTANYSWSTISYTWVNVTYDNTSTVNLWSNTTINWQPIATQWDVAWLSNWKETVRLATTNAADTSNYTYEPANEPTGNVWTWVNTAPTIDWNTLNDWDRLLIKDAADARGNWIFVYDAANSSFVRSADANNDPQNWEVAAMMVWIHDWDTNYWKIFREIHTSPITLGTDTVDLTPFIISVVAWETNTSSNEWSWVWLAMAKNWVNLPFKSLVAGTNISITDNWNEVLIASTAWSWMTCTDVVDCVENATSLDLSNVNVTLWDVLNTGTTTYSNTAVIDYTNVTTTWTQNFDSNYTANYNWSTINNTNVTETNTGWTVNNVNQTINNDNQTEVNNNWTTINNDNTTENNTNVTENYDSTSVTNNNGNTINNNWSTTNNTNNAVTNYDSTTTVNMDGDTNIENLTVNNITTQWGGNVVVNWSWIRQNEDTVWATEILLTDTPLSWEAWLLVFKQDSWLHRTATDDYTYDSVNNKITFPALVSWDKIEVRYMKWWWAQIQQVVPATVSWNSYTANFGEYVLVTNNASDTDINLPDATSQNWWVIKIKKFTWEDTLTVRINPVSWQLIDWYTWATMNVDRTMYTFTSIDWNRYLGD